MSDENQKIKRHIALRILFGVLWFIPIYLLIQSVVGAIVGGMAGTSSTNYGEGYAAGNAASLAFFHAHGHWFLLLEVSLTAFLSYVGALPGTGKWKRG